MIALLAALAHAEPAPALPVDLAEEADLLFRRGVEAYNDGMVELALERLLASNRLVPNRQTAFNVARCYERLGQLDQAWRYYDAYARAETVPQARADAEQALKRLEPQVARVDVRSDPPGATVYVERRDLGARGTTPLALALPEGRHTVILDLDGHESASRSATWTLGAPATLDVKLAPTAAPAPAPAPAERWSETVVSSGPTVLLRVSPAACAILPDHVQGSGAPLEGPEPAARGSALLATSPPGGLAVETTLDGHPVRLALARADKRSLALLDASPLHGAFARCRPTDPGGLAGALRALAAPARLDAVAVLAEWAALRGGAAEVPAAAAACGAGDCEALVGLLVR